MNSASLWFTNLQIVLSTLVGIFTIVLGFAKRKPSLVSLGALAVVELAILTQLVLSIALVSGGSRAETDTVEFFSYLMVALIIPIAAGFWALVERNRWSTMVLGVAALTVAIMLFRMQQIWFG